MPNGLIAKKVGMSRVFLENGEAVPVTYLKVEPNVIVRTKNQQKDGYNAVVLGIGAKKWRSRKGKENTRFAAQKEWAVESLDGFEPGKELTVELVPVQSMVSITGISKGRGFQGVVKRYGMAGGPATHGSHFHRRPGSIGMREWPGRVLKGKKLPGRMGGETVSLRNCPVLVCDIKNGMLAIKGPIPGPNGATVYVTLESGKSDSSSEAS